MLKQLEFRYDLHDARSRQTQIQQRTRAETTSDDEPRTRLRRWTIQGGYTITWEDEENLCKSCLWGTQYAKTLCRWWSMLTWPDHPAEGGPGISWYELATNFLLVTQFPISINAAPAGQQFQPRTLRWHELDVPFSQQVFAFERAISQLHNMSCKQLPHPRKKHCPST